MMNLIRNCILIFVFSPLLFSSCEKVISLKLDDTASIIVIDGAINDQNENQLVKISRTNVFSEPNKFIGIGGAKVVLTRPNGSTVTYSEMSPGLYQSVRTRGIPGNKYTLNVTLEGKTYTASSTMPGKVTLDSISFKQFNFFGAQSTYVAVNYNDPPNVENQYRYILKVRGKIEEDRVNEDRFNNGNKVSDITFYEIDDLKSGEIIDVEFQCIDKNVYRYFYALGQNNGGGGPPVAPANPISNFNNGALGIFNAHTSGKRSIVIK